MKGPNPSLRNRSILALLFTGALAAAGTSGCTAAPNQPAPAARDETLARIEAQPQTRAESGIDAWIVTRNGQSVLVDGRTAGGVSIHQVLVQPFSATVVRDGRSRAFTGIEMSSSDGGLVRITSDRHVVTFRPDEVTFAAFARDTEALRQGDVTLNCGFFDWIGCLGAVLTAGAACGAFGLECVEAILGLGSCFECFCHLFGCGGGGGGDSGPCGGPTPSDCGDGCFACPDQPCPLGPCGPP